MNRRTAVLSLLAGIGLALTRGAAPAAQADCVSVQGTVVGQQISSTSFVGTVTGDLVGTAMGTNFQVLKVTGDGTFHFVVDHVFSTPVGDLYFTTLEGVLSPMAPPVYMASEHNVVLGGAGAFAGATGNIDIHGMIDLVTGQFAVTYHGEVCSGQ
jgi:hypothetical protein